MAPPVDESTILKPKNPAIIDNNDWPDFPLTQVEVYEATTGEPTSLLTADADNPLTVVGKLESLPRDRLGYLLERASLPATIQINNVQTFSYGQYDEGKVALWAAGEAGWFELKPSRSYRPIFNEMTEAVNILYFLADYYRELPRQKLRSTAPEAVFEAYAEEPSNKCRDLVHTITTFQKHIRFLLASMRSGKENISWKQTQIYKYLEREDSPSVTPEENMNGEEQISTLRATPEAERPIRSGKSKSILRPRSDRLSMKGAGHRTSLLDEDGDTTMKLDDILDQEQSPLKRKTTPKPSGRAVRRQRRELATDDTVPSFAEEDLIAEDAIAASNPKLPLLSVPRKPKKTDPILYIKDEPLPLYEAQGPGDTWTCTFDGCIHRVYGASLPKSRDLIKEHYRSHAVSAQAQIDLVYKEERPYLPVGNLIQKIRAMAAQKSSMVSVKPEN